MKTRAYDQQAQAFETIMAWVVEDLAAAESFLRGMQHIWRLLGARHLPPADAQHRHP
jgi:hypothetical protein